MAAIKVIHFPLSAQLGPTPLFRAVFPASPVCISPPDLFRLCNRQHSGAQRPCAQSAKRGDHL
jgi:hypothetical protein